MCPLCDFVCFSAEATIVDSVMLLTRAVSKVLMLALTTSKAVAIEGTIAGLMGVKIDWRVESLSLTLSRCCCRFSHVVVRASSSGVAMSPVSLDDKRKSNPPHSFM